MVFGAKTFREFAAMLGSSADTSGVDEWGLLMRQAGHELGRAGGHAVDIAAQIRFLVTGELHGPSGAGTG